MLERRCATLFIVLDAVTYVWRSQLGWITTDNATNMDSMVKAIGVIIDPDNLMLVDREQRRIR
jgi:hypothetical protein